MTSTRSFTGMPLDERLKSIGALDKFAQAVRQKDEATMLSLLTEVGITGNQAADTAKSFLLDPSSYKKLI